MENLVMDRARRVRARRMRVHARTRWLCAALAAALMLISGPAAFAGEGPGGTAAEGGLGMAAALSSLIYGPTKIVYAVGGTTAAGFAWLFSGGDSKVASTVFTRSVRGTYVITPQTLQGREEIEFVGRSPEYRDAAPQVASAPEAW